MGYADNAIGCLNNNNKGKLESRVNVLWSFQRYCGYGKT